MNIKNIVFDFGGVLIDWNPAYLYDQIFTDKDEMNFFLENVCNSAWNMQQDAGRPFAEATRILQEKFPAYHEMIQLFYDRWEEMVKGAIPENVKLLAPLKEKYRMFGLTNWSGEAFPIAYKKYPFFQIFEGIVVSGDEKLIKPFKEIYLLLLERYKLQADECLFIDDNKDNIITARELGFHAIHLHQECNLEEELKQLKVI